MSSFIILLLLSSCCIHCIEIPWPPKTGRFAMRKDNFNFLYGDVHFWARYLYEDKWYAPGGPVLFYCGNEGPIEAFWNNTGFVFDLASTLKGYVIFVEHRYYGESLLFGNLSFSQPYISLLSIEQALADYAHIIYSLRGTAWARDAPVIAVGGSYGGMLAVYMRLVYPHLVIGAFAASAPVRWVAGEGGLHTFFETVTKDFNTSSPSCANLIREGFEKCQALAVEDPDGLAKLSKKLQLCSVIADDYELQWVFKWMRNSFVMMAMLNYPVKSSFMSDLPAYPVNASCVAALSAGDPIDALREAVRVFYGDTTCFDFKKEFIECADITGCGLGNDALAWDFQSCTEMNLYDPVNTTEGIMFPALPLTREALIAYCARRWSVTPAFDRLAMIYGTDRWKTASNIIFSNGDVDPWSGGGILQDLNPTVKAVVIKGGAHHSDLRSPDVNDPPSLKEARQIERDIIAFWLKSV